MELSRFNTFEIILGTDIKLNVTNFRSGHELFFYEISSKGIIHGKLSPTFDGITSRIIWQTFDNIDPLFVKQIGDAVEKHYL